MATVNEVVQTVLAKTIKAVGLPVGKYDLTGTKVTIELSGTMEKRPDEEYTPTVSVPVKAALILALQKAGVQDANISKILVEAMKEALAIGEKGEDAIKPHVKKYDEIEKAFVKTLAKLPKQTREGKTLTKDVNVKIDVKAGSALVDKLAPVVPVSINVPVSGVAVKA